MSELAMRLDWVSRFMAVVTLLAVAAALATPPNRLPLALRALAKILPGAPRAAPGEAGKPPGVPVGRRLVAFALVLIAALVAGGLGFW